MLLVLAEPLGTQATVISGDDRNRKRNDVQESGRQEKGKFSWGCGKAKKDGSTKGGGETWGSKGPSPSPKEDSWVDLENLDIILGLDHL